MVFSHFLIVFFGSGIGGMLRHGLVSCMTLMGYSHQYYAILLCNIIGSFLAGGMIGYQMQHFYKLLLLTGIAGGFTTFSALNIEFFKIFHAHGWKYSAFYMMASLSLGIISTLLGIYLGQKI